MKLTETVIELMFELSDIEFPHNAHYLCGDGAKLIDNLLTLFNETKNPATHEIIIDIMNEAGHPFLGHDEETIDENINAASNLISAYKCPDQLMSDDQFLDLLPANSYFH